MRGVKIKKSQLKNRILKKTGGVCAACGRTLNTETHKEGYRYG
jgi:hypothetical protein